MSISIGFDYENMKPIVTSSCDKKELNMSPDEEKAFIVFSNFLATDRDSSKIRVERRSNSYISLIYGENNDFLRFKFSNRTKWLSIGLTSSDARSNSENPLFAAQINKNQRHWKARINSLDELPLFEHFIVSACKE